VRINDETVDEYAEAMKATTGRPWPPVVVFFDGTEYWMADGFHRLLAARRIGRNNIAADVKQGTREDAAWAACAANQAHGLRRTNEDKQRAVEIALRLHPELSAHTIAEHCGVSQPFASEIRRQVITVITCPLPEKVTGRDGKQYPAPSSGGKKDKGKAPKSRAELVEDQGPETDSTTAEEAESGHVPIPPPPAPEKPKPRPPVDDVGRLIPDQVVPLWGRRQEVQDMLTALSRVRVALQKAQVTRDPLFSEVPFSSALAHLDQVYNAMQVAKPYAVCAFCQGHGCKVCGQRGLLGKFRWDTTVPKEHKEAVARLVAQEGSGRAA
jgi:hypothetical protein